MAKKKYKKKQKKFKKKFRPGVFSIVSFILFLFFIIPFAVHNWASNLSLQLHFCNHIACVVYSFIWLGFSIVGWSYLKKTKNKKTRRKTRKSLIIMAIIVLIVGIFLMNITYCDIDGAMHFSDFTNWFASMTQLNTDGGCKPGVDCPVLIPPCVDTDDGHDYISYGTILSGLNIDDKCMNSDTLRERFCSSTLTYSSEDIHCKEDVGDGYYCLDGECVLDVIDEEEPETGIETDCGDGIDNDGDGDFDCADSDCDYAWLDGGCGDFDYSCMHNPTSPYPFCGGTCPTGEVCSSYEDSWCECMPVGETACESSAYPTCGGWCIDDYTCVPDVKGCICEFTAQMDCWDTGINPLIGGYCVDLETDEIYYDECMSSFVLLEYRCIEGLGCDGYSIICNNDSDFELYPEMGYECINQVYGDYCGAY